MSKAQEVGKRIAQARREKGVREQRDVRPADVARSLDVSGATVSDWESGKVTPREDALVKLATFLGVSPAFLRYGVPVQPGPTTPSPEENADFVNGEKAAARAEREQGAATKAAGGSTGRSRKQ